MNSIDIRRQRLIDAAKTLHPDLQPCGDLPFTCDIRGNILFWFNFALDDGMMTTGVLSERHVCPECGAVVRAGETCNCKAGERL